MKLQDLIIRKFVIQLWCSELMTRLDCSTPNQLQFKIDDVSDSPESRASNAYYKYFIGLRFPRPERISNCEVKVKDSQWLITHQLWEILSIEMFDTELANLYFSRLNRRYLNRLSGAWWSGTNLYKDSFTNKVLRYTTLDSLAILVILIKLAKHQREPSFEDRVARQLYRGLLIIGAQVPDKNGLRATFFSIFRRTVFSKINWMHGRQPVLDFALYQFGVQYLGSHSQISENLGLTLTRAVQQKLIKKRSEKLLLELLYQAESLNLFFLPPRSDIDTFNAWCNFYLEIDIRLSDLRDMKYSFNDKSMSLYLAKGGLIETANFIRKYAPYKPEIVPSQSMVDKLFP